MNKRIYVEEVQAILNVDASTVYKWHRDGLLAALYINKRMTFNVDEIERIRILRMKFGKKWFLKNKPTNKESQPEISITDKSKSENPAPSVLKSVYKQLRQINEHRLAAYVAMRIAEQ